MRIIYIQMTDVVDGDVKFSTQREQVLSQKGWPVNELVRFIKNCAREGSELFELTPYSFEIRYPTYTDYEMSITARDIIVIDDRGYQSSHTGKYGRSST